MHTIRTRHNLQRLAKHDALADANGPHFDAPSTLFSYYFSREVSSRCTRCFNNIDPFSRTSMLETSRFPNTSPRITKAYPNDIDGRRRDGSCEQVLEQITRLDPSELEICGAIVPYDAVLPLLDKGPRRALTKVLKHETDRVHPVAQGGIDDGGPLVAVGAAKEQSVLGGQPDGGALKRLFEKVLVAP